MEIEVEEDGNLAKGDTKRKEPETGFVSHLHKNKGREVPKAAAKSRDSSRSSESSSRPDYNRSSSAEPSPAPPSPGPPSSSRGPEAAAAFLEKEKSLEKGMEVEEPKRKVVLLPKLPGMVAVDWYKTVEQPNGELDTESLQKLKDSNVRVWIVSFCGKSQARKVKQKCGPLRDQGLIEGVSCINERCGQWGKVSLCQDGGSTIFSMMERTFAGKGQHRACMCIHCWLAILLPAASSRPSTMWKISGTLVMLWPFF